MSGTFQDFTGIEPVAIALDQIELGRMVRFAGIDLETGLRIRVVVERIHDANAEQPALKTLQAHGLLLMLSVEQISSDS